MISAAQAAAVVQPYLDYTLMSAIYPTLVDVTVRLNAWSEKIPPEKLTFDISNMLMLIIRSTTDGTMRRGDGTRITLDMCDEMADSLMGLAFDQLPVTQANLECLRDYSLHHESLGALKTLYTVFAPLQSDEEIRSIARVVRMCHSHRDISWLKTGE